MGASSPTSTLDEIEVELPVDDVHKTGKNFVVTFKSGDTQPWQRPLIASTKNA